MGVKRHSTNRRKNSKTDKANRWHRAVKAERKKRAPIKTLEIEDMNLLSKEMLKKKMKNPQNNIKLSGKKRRILTKRLGHALKEKSRMEVEEIPQPKKKTVVQQDAVMTEVKAAEPEPTIEVEHEAPSTSTASLTGSASKKRRGRKRNKKGTTPKTSTGADEKMFDDGWEDVEMEED